LPAKAIFIDAQNIWLEILISSKAGRQQ
jgi:hypothetical protein